MKRHGYIIGGQVQGVGFRPFVYRAATRLRLTGHVGNTSDGVRVEVQGTDEALAAFAHALEHELPPLAQITSLRREELPLADGEAAFYGPKLDIQIKSVHGKEDTLITIQIDFQLAEKFGMEYVDRDNKRKYPYVIHRTSIGCYERTLALLIEKYAGAFPLWLAPEQARVILISDDQKPYAEEVLRTLKDAGLRASLDDRNEKLGFKIREAQLEKLPYMLIVGGKEAENGTVGVRSRKEGDLGAMTPGAFIEKAAEEIRTKAR